MKNTLKGKLSALFLGAALLGTSSCAAQGNINLPPALSPALSIVPASDENKYSEYSTMDFSDFLKENHGNAERAWEEYEFFNLRTFYFHGSFNKMNVDEAIQKINILETLDPDSPIKMYISSYGGNVDEGMRLYNAIQTSPSDIHGIGDGYVASMAAFILVACDYREIMPNTSVLIHEIRSGARGQASSMETSLVDTLEIQDELFKMVVDNTGLSYEDVRRICRDDVWYNAEEALTLGFVDNIIEGKPSRALEPGSRAVPENLFPENRARDYYQLQPR